MKLNFKALFGADFGKLDASYGVAITLKGTGIKTADGQIAVLNKETKEITLVPDELTLGDLPTFAIPSQSIEVGDLVLQNRTLKFVTGKEENGILTVINYKGQTEERLIPTKTMFGYVAAAKVISPFGDIAGAFGGADGKIDEKTALMFALMGGDDSKLGALLPMLLMGGADGKIDEKTVMMLAMLGDDDSDMDSMLPLLFMGGLGKDSKIDPMVMALMLSKGGLF